MGIFVMYINYVTVSLETTAGHFTGAAQEEETDG